MRALRKTHLKRMWPKFFGTTPESDSFDHRLWKLPRRGNRGKRTTSFPPFPPRLENSANALEFSTVPTASNAGYCAGEKKRQRLREGLSKIEWTRCSQKRKNLSSRPLSIGRF